MKMGKGPRGRLAYTLALVLGVALGAGSADAVPPAPGTYTQPTNFEWDTAELDVLIVPPGHGQLVNGNGLLGGRGARELTPEGNSYLAAIEQSVLDWRRAVTQFGPSWLDTHLSINKFVVGRDVVPAQTLADPEIVIVADETKGPILGLAVSSRVTPCIVDNSMLFLLSFTDEDMYNVNGQEFGHCLGLGHVDHPEDDVMNGTYAYFPGLVANARLCVSNLNVAGLERVFAERLGEQVTGVASVSSAQYQRIAC